MTSGCTYTLSTCYRVKLTIKDSRVGESAKNAFHSNPQNTVFDAKRLIGRSMDDPNMKRDLKHWPFRVEAKNGKPAITVKYKGEDRDFASLLFFNFALFFIFYNLVS